MKTKTLALVYQKILKPVYFRMDPEAVHDRMIRLGKILGSNPLTQNLTSVLFSYQDPKLEQTTLGLKFKNPVGLAAGFDKNAELTEILPALGFGFMEVGSITGEPCPGNPKPRLWRLPKSKSLLVYYGLKNDGAEKLSEKLLQKKFKIPLITSIARTNCKEVAETNAGIKDYVKGFRSFTDIGFAFTINISCPNAFGGQPFTEPKSLDLLMSELDKIPTEKPVFLKISPDLSKTQVNDVLKIAGRHRIHGFIVANLTKNRRLPTIKDENLPGVGGMSGKIEEDLTNELLKYVYQKTKGKYVLIGLGGIFSDEDAYRKIKLGASLVQLITGMIYQGPQLIGKINKGLVKLLTKDGYQNISEAVGKGV